MRAQWAIRGGTLPIGGRTLLMGILNVTPDSFSDGGRFLAPEAALAHGETLAAEGADILDVGGESTRPGSAQVDAEEELARVLPIVQALAGRLAVPVSIDTYKAGVAAAAVEAGARIVNDVWGFQRDPDIARIAADSGAGVVLMHNRLKFDTAVDMLAEVKDFLARSLDVALGAGVREEAIVLDPGIGFGKTTEQDLMLIGRIGDIRAMGFPVLLGASRKKFIGRLTDQPDPMRRLGGTLGAHLMGVAAGADIVRAHDVAAHRDALTVLDAIRAAA
ncbi:MAG TPA: dihydropteroate synthase [Hyphomicrobiales bacterium]|nr:dihydropteroate synthase [Hyphomicrobiales bacterium]